MPNDQLQVPPPQVRFMFWMVHWELHKFVRMYCNQIVTFVIAYVVIIETSGSAAGAAKAVEAERTARTADVLNFILTVVGCLKKVEVDGDVVGRAVVTWSE